MPLLPLALFQARRYFLTAERISAVRAKEIGLLHEVVETPEELDVWAATFRKAIGEASPSAIAASKDLIRAVGGQPISSDLIADTARRLADQRASPDGVEGLSAFFEKRPAVSYHRGGLCVLLLPFAAGGDVCVCVSAVCVLPLCSWR